MVKVAGEESVLLGGLSAVGASLYPWVFRYTYAELKLDSSRKIRKLLETSKRFPMAREVCKNIQGKQAV